LSFLLLVRRLFSAFLYPGFEGHPESRLSFESGPTVGESSSQFLILIFGPGLSESRKGKGHPDRDVVFLNARSLAFVRSSESLAKRSMNENYGCSVSGLVYGFGSLGV